MNTHRTPLARNSGKNSRRESSFGSRLYSDSQWEPHHCHSLPSLSHRRRLCLRGFSYFPVSPYQDEGKDGTGRLTKNGLWELEPRGYCRPPKNGWTNPEYRTMMAALTPNPEKSGCLDPYVAGVKTVGERGSEMEKLDSCRYRMTAGRKPGTAKAAVHTLPFIPPSTPSLIPTCRWLQGAAHLTVRETQKPCRPRTHRLRHWRCEVFHCRGGPRQSRGPELRPSGGGSTYQGLVFLRIAWTLILLQLNFKKKTKNLHKD